MNMNTKTIGRKIRATAAIYRAERNPAEAERLRVRLARQIRAVRSVNPAFFESRHMPRLSGYMALRWGTPVHVERLRKRLTTPAALVHFIKRAQAEYL